MQSGEPPAGRAALRTAAPVGGATGRCGRGQASAVAIASAGGGVHAGCSTVGTGLGAAIGTGRVPAAGASAVAFAVEAAGCGVGCGAVGTVGGAGLHGGARSVRLAGVGCQARHASCAATRCCSRRGLRSDQERNQNRQHRSLPAASWSGPCRTGHPRYRRRKNCRRLRLVRPRHRRGLRLMLPGLRYRQLRSFRPDRPCLSSHCRRVPLAPACPMPPATPAAVPADSSERAGMTTDTRHLTASPAGRGAGASSRLAARSLRCHSAGSARIRGSVAVLAEARARQAGCEWQGQEKRRSGADGSIGVPQNRHRHSTPRSASCGTQANACSCF